MDQPQRDNASDGGLRLADIGVFGSFAAMGVTAVGLWMLRDFDALGGNARILRGLAYGLSVAVLAFSMPAISWRLRGASSGVIEHPQVACASGLLLATLVSLGVLGSALQLLSWSAPLVIALIAAIAFVFVVSDWWRCAMLMERIAVPLLSAALGAWMGACFWGYGMQNPAFLTKAALSRYVTTYNPAIDTLFHASIINSVKSYGTVSVGLDGLVPLPYHAFTHVFFAALSALGEVSAIDFLNASSPAILLPLVPVSLVVFAASAARAWSTARATDRPMLARWPIWAVLFAAFAGIVPQPFAGNFFLNWKLIIHSETYGLSVSLGLLGAAFLVTGLSERFVRDGAATPRDYIVLTLAVIGYCLISFTKLSTGLVLLVGMSWLFLRLRLYRSWGATAALAVTFVCAAFIASIGAPSSIRDAMPVEPFAFLRLFIGLDRVVPFLLLFYIWALLYLLLRGIYPRSADRGVGAPRGWRSIRALDLEFIGVLILAGMVPGLVFDLPPRGPQSATVNVYFMDVQIWFAIGLLLALAVNRGREAAALPVWAVRPLPFVIAAASLAALGIATIPNFLKEFRGLSMQDEELRKLVREHPDWPNWPEARTLAGLVALGDAVRKLPRGVVAVHIPQSNDAYWQLRVHGCEVVPFLALGIAGVAMIDGLPPPTCKSPNLNYYGYQQYARRDLGGAAAGPVSDARLCERAAELGVRELLILDGFPAAGPRPVKCGD